MARNNVFKGSGLMRPVPAGAAYPTKRTAGVAEMIAERSLQSSRSPPPPTPQPLPDVEEKTESPELPDVPDYVLYVHPKCPTCRSIKERLGPHQLPKVYMQNVLLLQDRPPWMDGVPSIADTHLGMIYRGTDALVFLESLIKVYQNEQQKANRALSRVLAAQPAPSPGPAVINASIESPKDTVSKMDSLFEMAEDDDESVETDPRIREHGEKKLSDDRINEMMRMREKQHPSSKQII